MSTETHTDQSALIDQYCADPADVRERIEKWAITHKVTYASGKRLHVPCEQLGLDGGGDPVCKHHSPTAIPPTLSGSLDPAVETITKPVAVYPPGYRQVCITCRVVCAEQWGDDSD